MKHFTLFILFVFIISCGNKKPAVDNQDLVYSYTDRLIEIKMKEYTLKSPQLYQELPPYQLSNELIKKTNDLVSKIVSLNVTKGDLNDYRSFISTFNKKVYDFGTINFLSDIESIDMNALGNDDYRVETVQKIKLVELTIIDRLLASFDAAYFDIDSVRVDYKAKKETIKLGETFEAEIFFAGWNSGGRYAAVVDGDTLKTDSTEFLPLFSFTPTEKGKKIHEGSIFPVAQPSNSYPFTIEYTVE
jgi:hypothetical protein